ncbi:putative trna (cytosine-5-)-methyltransferase ncl1 [Erysiphe necator]|uniref:Putative trna (Cytosine-5-)-methyltransferase ncl1 n=1 Tax=Uncinula necator TaxID=52586 RepID=A0A0B1PBK4_UNCNE|nr:putative trna (cytosine-5-)-methyltransferase ncl1 [Erysiphe necator]
MGRGGKRGKFRVRNCTDKCQLEDNRVSFDKVPKSNERFEKYYNQILGLSDDEKSVFWEALKRELPNSFRFTGSKSHALAVQKLLKDRYIPQISAISHHDGTLVKPPEPVNWYPDELAWWMTTPKSVVRRSPPFAAFQKFLVSETSVGNISRQEVVSMIPPLLMDLKPGMTVLDMCAAPGSKAAQLLEMIHAGEEFRMRKSINDYAQNKGQEIRTDSVHNTKVDLNIDNEDFGRATGLLIANDSDYKRSHMLIHQLKRLSSPNLIVTNHDATMYPSIKLASSSKNSSANTYLKFDRILADVPCSGDGTIRKNVNLWKDWNPGSAIGLHMTQVRILVRALQMLKVGGRVVYSTCSMNPIENEAVVSTAILRSGGLSKVRLLSCDDDLPLLKRKQGLRNWCVMDKAGKIWSSWNEVLVSKEKNESSPWIDKLLPGMFPSIDSPESQIPLQNCVRVYAHLQDTGGFFIAVLEKLSEFRTKPESKITPMTSSSNHSSNISSNVQLDEVDQTAVSESLISNMNPANIKTEEKVDRINHKRSIDELDTRKEILNSEKKQKLTEIVNDVEVHETSIDIIAHENMYEDHEKITLQTHPNRNKYGTVEEPFKYISDDHAEIQAIESFYKLSSRFPRDRFMVRNVLGHPTKTIYYTSSLVRNILTENEGHGIKFIHGGVKMFMKQDVQGPNVCKWRIQAEGMPILEGYVGEERVIYLSKKETLRKLLIEMFPKIADEAWKDLGEIGEQVRNIGMGCLVLRTNPSSEEDGIQERMVLPLWRSAASLNLMLAKEDRTALLLRIFNDNTPLINYSKEARTAAIKHASAGDSKEQIEINELKRSSELDEKKPDLVPLEQGN